MASSEEILQLIWNADQVAQNGQLDISDVTQKVQKAKMMLLAQQGNGSDVENQAVEDMLEQCDHFLDQMATYRQQALRIRAAIARIHEESLERPDAEDQ